MYVVEGQALCVFFFQAEDGIRDIGVTGVQTCALPISHLRLAYEGARSTWKKANLSGPLLLLRACLIRLMPLSLTVSASSESRSEERRVGKECRSRWSTYH